MTDPRPQWLLDALAKTTPVLARKDQRVPIKPGDIRRLIPMDETDIPARLVLVQHVDETVGYADVWLLSPEIDMASDADVLLRPETTGLAYPLLLLTDVSAPVYLVQIANYLSEVPTTAFLEQPAAGEPATDERDPRWTWKERELDALTGLTAECTAELIDGPGASVIDPRSFAHGAESVYSEAAALAAFRACKAGDSQLPHTILRILAGSGQGNLAASSARNILDEIARRSPGSMLFLEEGAAIDVDLGDVADDELLLSAVIAALDVPGRRNIRLLTTSNLWINEHFAAVCPGSAGGAAEIVVNGRRCQMLATIADELENASV